MRLRLIGFLFLICKFLPFCIRIIENTIFYFRKDNDKLEKIKALRESSKRVNLGPETLPSICFYTLLNANHGYEVKSAFVAFTIVLFCFCLE